MSRKNKQKDSQKGDFKTMTSSAKAGRKKVKKFRQFFIVETEMPRGFDSSNLQIALIGMMVKVASVKSIIEAELTEEL